ncbi:hypothetical protein OF829_18270 [Sphingomonas sp. LB-2]|uniref:hypothetical protein n=1 Tax=Sphingomonas caeni TaxID=2984949 RepID=UPI00222FD3A6|nr:hypothetical protein [Sphingomonas caeni]MCW3849189.1 hypothetical protein [Sphingomonas caeni]
MSLVLAMLAVTATCVPSDAPKLTKLEVATGFFAAFNGGDQAGMGSFIKPGALMIRGPGESMELASLLSNVPPDARIEVTDMKLDDAGNVVVHSRDDQGHETMGMIKLEGGCISEISHQG